MVEILNNIIVLLISVSEIIIRVVKICYPLTCTRVCCIYLASFCFYFYFFTSFSSNFCPPNSENIL